MTYTHVWLTDSIESVMSLSRLVHPSDQPKRLVATSFDGRTSSLHDSNESCSQVNNQASSMWER